MDSRHIGKVRALRVAADGAIYPRMAIVLGLALHEVQSAGAPGPLVDYELCELTGELRLDEHGRAIGTLQWLSKRRHVQSSANYYEHQVTVLCDLDPWRLEKIEALRGGVKSPDFWLQLWPALRMKGEHLDVEIRSFRMQLSREQWLEFLSAVRADRHELIEVRFDPGEAEAFKSAVGHTRKARERLAVGDYRDAVGECRLAWEAFLEEHPDQAASKEAGLWEVAARRGEERAIAHYRGVLSNIKQLTAMTHHAYGAKVVFRRAEAQFVVRTTENLLALIGDLTVPE